MTVSSMPTAAQPTASVVAATLPDRPRTWVRRIIGGGQSQERCPEWCTADHRVDTHGNLDDLTHVGDEVAVAIPVVHHWTDGEPVSVPLPALTVQIRQDPYSESPRRRQPFAVVELANDEVVDELSPDGLAAIIAQVRAHLDRMEQVHAHLVRALAARPGAPAAV